VLSAVSVLFAGDLLLLHVSVAALALFGIVKTIEEKLRIASFELRLLYHACWEELKVQLR
jgi:hypothetical protein